MGNDELLKYAVENGIINLSQILIFGIKGNQKGNQNIRSGLELNQKEEIFYL